jgi:AraC-like DNA-binding protein/ligand-binding sensor protein
MKILDIENQIFTELGKEKKLILYHDIIYKLTNLVIDYVNSEGKSMKILPVSHLNLYCRKFRASLEGPNRCAECDKQHIRQAVLQKKELIYQCHAGLYEVIVPLFDASGNYIGSMTAGQFLLTNEAEFSPMKIAPLARALKSDPEELYQLYISSTRISNIQLSGIIDFLREIGNFVIDNRNKLLFLKKINTPDRIEFIEDFIQKNYQENLTVPGVAKRFFLSPHHFSRIFKRHTGVTFVEYLNLYRVNQAQTLLESSHISISEMAFLLGFGSVSQFYRAFKNVTQISPANYRKNLLIKRA